MIRLRLVVAGSVLGLFALGIAGIAPSSHSGAPTPSAITPSDSGAVAVVELFTSEGCSSCPPADRLLQSVVERARSNDRPVYALSFHVDYWNRLGWKDPYSKSAFSERQRRYARTLGVDTYTPQIVVNGQRVMVGSRAGEVQGAIESALGDRAEVGVDLSVERNEDDLAVTYRLSDAPDDADLRLALVERGLSQKVTRGENAGRTLSHANVVRTFTSVPAGPDGTAQLSVPDAVDRSKASVIAYAQDSSLTILGAARVDLREG